MSDQQRHAYPPENQPPHPSQSAYPPEKQPPHPSQSAYPPAMGYPPMGQPGYGVPPPGYAPPGGQLGYGMPPPGQPGYGMPPPGQLGYGMPPPGQPGYGMPPPGYGAPPPGQPGFGAPYGMSGYPHPGGFKQSSGNESDDSQPGDTGPRSSNKGKSIKCTFENHAGTKVMLCKIDEHGKPHKVMKMKKGKKEEVHVHEGDVFFASGKKKRKRRVMINNNTVYTVMAEQDGESKVRAEILNGPEKVKDLSSEKTDVEVKVKFVNRTKRKVQVVWIDHKKKWEKKKVLKPGKCYTTKSYEGNCWVAHDEKDEDEGLFLNYGYFYSPWKTRRAIERVIITEDRPWSDSSGSSSDSD